MRKILIFLFSLFLFLPVVSVKALQYTNRAKHYSFIVPNGWIEIPKSTIDQVMHRLADMTNSEFIDYTAGFQIKSSKLFQYPYILIQEHSLHTTSYDEFLKLFNDDRFKKQLTKKINEEYSEVLSNSSFDKPFVDRERQAMFINFDLNVAQIGKVKGLMAIFFGKDGIVQLNFYSKESEYKDNLPIFQQVIDSFHYEDGYQYQANNKTQVPTKSNSNSSHGNDTNNNVFNRLSIFHDVPTNTLIGAIAGGLGGLLISLFLRKRKQNH